MTKIRNLDGKEFYLAENIMNVVVFVPVGLLFGIAMCGRNVCAALLFGTRLSIGIEGTFISTCLQKCRYFRDFFVDYVRAWNLGRKDFGNMVRLVYAP